MEFLRNASPSSSSIIFLTRNGTRRFHPSTLHHSFLSPKQWVNLSVLHYSIGLKVHGISLPISASPSLSQDSSQVDLEESFSKSQNDETDTVRVKFLLQKECSFGEQFVLVGDHSVLGLWDPQSGIPLDWSDGHLWGVELDMPVGETIKYKFILKAIGGKLLWQPNPDRVLETWGTTNTIVVVEDWEDPQVQKIVDEEQIALNFVKEESVTDEADPNLDAADSGLQISEANLGFQESETCSDIKEEQTNQSVVVKEDPVTVSKEELEPVADCGLMMAVEENSVSEASETISNKTKTTVDEVDGSSVEKPLSLIADTISCHQEETLLVDEPEEPLLPSSVIRVSEASIEENNEEEVEWEARVELQKKQVDELDQVAEKKKHPSGSSCENDDNVLQNYMRWMQKLLNNIGLL